jgi:hypothetical protein
LHSPPAVSTPGAREHVEMPFIILAINLLP